MYYIVNIQSDNIPLDGMFVGKERMEERNFNLEFHWIPLEELSKIEVYPTNVV